ncbi:hypothetical protein A2810_01260 [candidate division Kazan bacterium RIFCSPHIGHO2_01_FULL_49_10]|uniref:SCP domain-containing protein n=1 Tax=candidate division Kazan bacterium RIFCSPLOWO2_01_FULL_48_13 TaxID=1798539 RepID=A0A1F4PP97_UNCK3|nr:MAG: hypothetical protein A2810_01260 [candidate division Kazan bacterium RIFCSPHIGHO2_01_FULL_49_10]OGB85478.1 MAG: hypothetical protein A2994_01425 [candidate division Kazan bacterium RIFCSPLOWO2_01_FULL_48_13]
MRLFIAITIVALGMLLTSCPKSSSNKLPASAPKLIVNSQPLSPVAWDTPGKSVRIQNPWAAEDVETLQNLARIPVYVWEQGNKLKVQYDQTWDLARHGLYALSNITPEQLAEGKRLMGEYKKDPDKFSGDGSAQLPNSNASDAGNWVVLSALEQLPPQTKDATTLTYNWDEVDSKVGGGFSFGICAIVTPYDKGVYLICPFASGPSESEQEEAQRKIKEERRRLGYDD